LISLIDEIIRLASGRNIWVAYSGGVDSHMLLHLLATAELPDSTILHAIHIDHGLHPNSAEWSQHCADIAAELNILFHCVKVNVNDIETLGMEAAARAARYQALQQALTDDDVLLTAQHQQDQAETLLLQLLRGAGPKGLSAMAEQSQLGVTVLIRPMLNTSQSDILSYAHQHQLQWIDDPSNLETRWNRNYIRHTLWPDISERWPSAAKTLSRSAQHCAEASELMAELAQQDLANLGVKNNSQSLTISKLLMLSPARYRNVLRYFIELQQLPLPSTTCLQKVIDEVCLAKQDSMPVVCWDGVEVRRYQDQLYIMPPLEKHDVNQVVEIDSLGDVNLGDSRILTWKKSTEYGINQNIITNGLTVRFRQGGEKIQLQGQTQHKTL